MSNEENRELEDFIQDWHWDEKSHRFAQELGRYLFQFIDYLDEQGFSAKTMRQHTGNCWCIGILECQHGHKDEFSPDAVFGSPTAWYEDEFRRKMSDSKYALNSYRSTWRKLYKYTESSGYFEHGSNDPYLELIDGQWHNIVMMYEAFKDKKPIIEFDVTHNKIYSYPANEYIESLSQRTREQTKQQYKEAVRKKQFLLFVKDFESQILRSYIFNLPTRK